MNNTVIDELTALIDTTPQMEVESDKRGSITPCDIDPTQTPLYTVDNLFLNPNAPLPPFLSWVTIGDRKAVDRQGIITFTAKKKQGKSLSVYALLYPIIKGVEFSNIKPTGAKPRLVIVFDTEMDKQTLQERQKRIYGLLGEDAARLQIVPLSPVPVSQRQRIIDETTKKYNPDIVVIDTADRLVKDFNNNVECAAVGEWLLPFAGERTVICVVHQNKAADNTQMRGHLGSLMEELAVENYNVKRESKTYSVISVSARNSYVDENTPPFVFAVDEQQRIIDPAAIIEEERRQKFICWHGNFKRAFSSDGNLFEDATTLSYSELIKRVMERDNLAETAAKEKIKTAREMGVIVKIGDDRLDPYKLAELPG